MDSVCVYEYAVVSRYVVGQSPVKKEWGRARFGRHVVFLGSLLWKSWSILGDVCVPSQDAQMVFSSRYTTPDCSKYRSASGAQEHLASARVGSLQYGTITVDNLLSHHVWHRKYL